MTLDQVINIKNCDVDITTGERVSHKEKYTRLINAVGGLDAVILHIPFSLTSIKNAIKNHDEYLNTLPLRTWDFAAENVKDLMYRKARITSSSLSERVCLLKEAARQWAENN